MSTPAERDDWKAFMRAERVKAEPCPACPFPDDRAECCHDDAPDGAG